jgi:hypothetical protein
MKAYRGVEVYLHAFFTSILGAVSGPLYPGGKIAVRVGFEAGRGQVRSGRFEEENPLPCREPNHISSDVNPVA